MRIVIAPDKFKGCLPAAEVAAAIASGASRADPQAQLDVCPVADGGEGTVAALVAATQGKLLNSRVMGPLPEMQVEAQWGMLGDGCTAVIEMAAASGLALLPAGKRDPMLTTTYGTGQLLLAAAEAGAKRIILGIGGSATTDAGIGCAQACGWGITLSDGSPATLLPPLCGRDMARVRSIQPAGGHPFKGIHIDVACDVTNPLFGPSGSAYVFSPQKGATAEQVRELDRMLEDLAGRLGYEKVAGVAGAGAAGGLGFGMMAYFGATLRSGIELVMDAVQLPRRLEGADLCITGEGKLDAQSMAGKAAIGVARLCKRMGVACVAVAGAVEDREGRAAEEGVIAAFSICDRPMKLGESVAEARGLIERVAENVVRVYKAGGRSGDKM